MKRFLIWTEDPTVVLQDLVAKLHEHGVWHTSNVYIPKLTVKRLRTKCIQIDITCDESYVSQDGLQWDEIFILEDDYPHILDYRIQGEPVQHVKPIKYVVVDKILDVESLNSIRRLALNSVYGGRNYGQFAKYIENDVKNTERLYSMWKKMNPWLTPNIEIKNVIFNDPATIVFWTDGTKTVVKCQDGDIFDPEKGLVLAISKKALGNKGNYCNELKKWLPKEESEVQVLTFDIKVPDISKSVYDLQKKIYEAFGIKKDNPREKVQKAYDILKDHLNGNEFADLEGALGHLGEALED